MRKRRRILVLAMVMTVCFAAWQIFRPRELVYRGHPVSDWVEIYCRQGTNATLHLEAVCNLIDLGSNSVPSILHIAATHDSPIKKTLLKVTLPDELLKFLKVKEKYKRWVNAAMDRPPMAERAFLLIGRDNQSAIPGLLQLLSSENPASRHAAATMLQAVGPSAQRATPALLSMSRNDPDALVRTAAQEALRAIEPARFTVVEK